MKLLISQMNEGENPFHFTSLQDGWVKDVIHHVEKQGYQVTSDMKLDMNLTKLEPDYYLRGRMEFSVRQTCARCAENFELPVKHQFDVALAHVSNVKIRSHQIAEESEELDINFFEGNEIDLTPVVQEQFFLSLPYQSLCRPDCRGICQSCGKNLNTVVGEHCDCVATDPVHPFSMLRGLKV